MPRNVNGSPTDAPLLQPVGQFTAWHAISPNYALLGARPFMHVGTLQAAIDRGRVTRSQEFLEFRLDVRNPLVCRDGIGAQHPVAGLVEWLETELSLDFSEVDDLLMGCRADINLGLPESVAGGTAAAAMLVSRGYDFLCYRNAVEDPGSVSWIVLNPLHARIVGRKTLEQAQALLEESETAPSFR